MTMKHLIAVPVAVLVMALPESRSPIAAETVLPMLKSMEPPEICLFQGARLRQATAEQARRLPGRHRFRRSDRRSADSGAPPGWPGKQALAATCRPARLVYDPHPTFNGMAVDPANNVVILSDENRGSLLTYNLTDGGARQGRRPSRTAHIIGSKVNLGFIAGVTVDPGRREIYTVNNDGGGLVVHSYDSHGDVGADRAG